MSLNTYRAATLLLATIVVNFVLVTPNKNNNDAPLSVFMVPHSHDDVGWVDDMDTMYNSTRPGNNTIKNIYDTVTEALLMNPSRRFISVEMYWLHRWWNDAVTTDTQRVSFKKLVANKQVEFVCGGWVMHDEAVSHYQADVDQMTLGHDFIIETFGEQYIPRTCWHIDPFGSVGSNAALYGKMSFSAFGTNRIPDNIKTSWEDNQELDFVWEGSHSGIESDKLFTHVMDSYGYCPPNIPRNAFWWDDYNFWKSPEPQVNESNVVEFAHNITSWFKKQSKWRRAQDILLWPYGCDLEHHNATLNMKQMDYIIDYINRNSDKFGLTVQYATLSEYFEALNALKSVEWPERGIQTNLSFLPLGTVSQYPGFYNESTEMHWWSGFFTSRPILKRKARIGSSVLVLAERLHVQSLFATSMPQEIINIDLPAAIISLRRAVAVIQHHDAIPGTCRLEVMDVYIQNLDAALKETQIIIENNIQKILDIATEKDTSIKLVAANKNEENQVNFDVYIYNPLAWARSHIVKISSVKSNGKSINVSRLKDVIVTNVNGTTIPSQYNSEEGGSISFFVDTLYPLGISGFNVQAKHQDEAMPMAKLASKNIILSNEYTEWKFDMNGNLLSIDQEPASIKFIQYPTDTTTNLKGDAYQWRPMSQAQNILSCKAPTFMDYYNNRSIVSQLILRYENGCVNGTDINITYTLNRIGPMDQQVGMSINIAVGPSVQSNVEIGIRIQSSVANENGYFHTDEGGFQHRLRVFNATKDKDPLNNVAGNFFPVVSSAYIRDTNGDKQLTIFTEHSHGITSSRSGEIEIMLHRRISSGFINLENVNKSISNFKVVFGTVQQYDIIKNRIVQCIEHPPFPFFHFSKSKPVRKEYIPIPRSFELPSDIHLMTLEIGAKNGNEGQRVIRVRLINLSEPKLVSSSNNLGIVQVNVTKLTQNMFIIKKWQVRTLTGGMEMNYAESSRLKWGHKSRHTIRSHNGIRKWSTGDVIVSVKPLDIVTLHLVVV